MKANLLPIALTCLCVSLARADYSPIVLTPESFTQDIVIEKGAAPPLANFTTATPDQGTNNYGSTFFEQGYMVSVPELGLPAHGTTFTSRGLDGHTFQMPPSYATNNAAFIGAANIPGTSTLQTQVVSTALSISDSTAYNFISILWASGGSNGVNGIDVTVTHANANQETFQITTIDWMNSTVSANGSSVAWVCGGRIALDGTAPINNQRGTAAAKLFSNDFQLSDSSPVTSVAFSLAGGVSSCRFFVFGVSGSMDNGTYTPFASVSGFNVDAVIEAGLPCNQNPGCNVTMDGGPNCNGYTYYEQGFGTNVGGNSPNNVGTQGLPGTGTTGMPHPGTTITSDIYSFQMPASYVGNDCMLIGNYPAGTLTNGIYGAPSYTAGTFTITSPQAYAALSILGSAGSGPCVLAYTVNYNDASAQSGSLSIVDWHNAAVGVFTTQGRVQVETPVLNNVGVTSSGRLWHNDIVLNNTTAAATNVVLSYTSGGRAMFFALSAQPTAGGNFSPIPFTGLNGDGIIEAGLPLYPSSLFNATTATMDLGTNNANYTWFERGWATNGALATASGLPPAGSIINSLLDATRHYQMPSTYTGPNAVLIDVNHKVANITPVTPTVGSALALLTAGASIGSGNTMTNTCILQHANGVNETNVFYAYDWFNTAVSPAFLSNGRADTRYRSLGNIFAANRFPALFETIFPMTETVSPVTNIQVQYKLAGGTSWTTYVLAVSATAGSVAPVLGPVIQVVGSATTIEGSNIVFSATESGTEPIANQWQFSPDSGVTWVNVTNGGYVSGATTTSLTNSSVGWTNAGQYRLTASNIAGSATNVGAALVVYSGLPDVTQPTDPISVFQPLGGSSPVAEGVANALDNLVGTNRDSKYLNYGVNGGVPFVGPVGLVVTPQIGRTAVSVLRIYTANDAQERDPMDYGLEGSNDGGNTWTPIAGGALNLPTTRNGVGAGASVPPNPLTHAMQEIRFPNTNGYLAYRLSFTNVANNATANSMQIYEAELLGVVQPTAPMVALQSPASVTVWVGGNPTFVVKAYGYPSDLAYQWYLNGATPIPDATNASYTLLNAQTSDSGHQFSCQVSNTIGATMSSSATLTVLDTAPTQPYPVAIMADRPMAFWRLDEPDDGLSDGNPGAVAYDYVGGNNGVYTNTTLGLPGYNPAVDTNTAAFFGAYYAGSVLADNFVGDINLINFAVPTNTPSASTAAFSVEAWVLNSPTSEQTSDAGIVTLGYGGGGEQFNLDCGSNPGHKFRFFIRDATGATYGAGGTIGSTNAVGPFPSGIYSWHHVVGVCDYPHSNIVLYVDGITNAITVGALTNGILPATTPISIGARQASSGSAHANQFLGTIDEVAIYGYALNATQVLNHYYAAQPPPVFTVNPTNTTVNENGPLTLYSSAYGPPVATYQWYSSSDTATWSLVSNQTNANLTIASAQIAESGLYYESVATGAYGSATSSVAQVTVFSSAPVIASGGDLPLTNLVYAGRTAVFRVTAYGTLPMTYQWYKNGLPLSDTIGITGSHTNVLTIANCQTNDQAIYQLQIININSGGTPTLSVASTLLLQNMPGFNGDGLGWTVQGTGSPVIANNTMPLTIGSGGTARSCFYNFPLYIGNFCASWTYRDLTGPGGADGMTFCLQNDPRGVAALGGGGGSLGYGPDGGAITPSIALEFNIYGTAGIAFHANGANGGYVPTTPVAIDGGNPIDVTLRYDGVRAQLTLTDSVAATTFTTDLTVGSLAAILGAETAYVGFTGADGGTVSTQTVSNFTFVPFPMLSAQVTSTNTVLLSWPTSIGGYALLQKGNVASGSWTASPAVVNLVGGQYQAVVPPSDGSEFYRLVLESIEP